MEPLITLGIVLLILLAAAVAYLFVQLRSFQRIDYSRMMQEEIQSSQLSIRLQMLDQLLNDLNDIELLRQQEHVQAIEASQRQLEEIAAGIRQQLAEELDRLKREPAEHVADSGTDVSGVSEVPILEQGLPAASPQPDVVQFLTTQRQKQIAELLESGQTQDEIVRKLAVSEHEVELVASIVFSESGG